MRIPKYLSPTSLALFESDKEAFYLQYCADNRPPRMKQTKPMAIGAGFDAFVKNYFVSKLLPNFDLNNPECKRFSIENIFEQQVDPQNQEWCFEKANALFEAYKSLGCAADLMMEIASAQAEGKVGFEFTVEGRVAHARHVDGIPLLGKPDCFFPLTKTQGVFVVTDWKVNGFCSRNPTSPKKGYVRCRTASGSTTHKDCQTMKVDGIDLNVAQYLEDIDAQIATQLCIYAWVLGAPCPHRWIMGIEQLCCSGNESVAGLRVASHRMRISEKFQFTLLERLASCWEAIQTQTVVPAERAKMLDLQSQAFVIGADRPELDSWFNDMIGRNQ